MNQIYAGFWRRLAALVVDCLVLAIPVVIAGHLLSNVIAWALGLKDVWI